jgi:hypothetical protein
MVIRYSGHNEIEIKEEGLLYAVNDVTLEKEFSALFLHTQSTEVRIRKSDIQYLLVYANGTVVIVYKDQSVSSYTNMSIKLLR